MSLIIITDHHHLHHHHQPHHPHHCRFWKDDTLAVVDQPQRHSALQVLRCSTNNTRYHPRGYHQSIKQLKWWIIQDRLWRAWKDKNLDITPEAAFVRHGWEIIVECRRRRTQRVIFTGWCYIFSYQHHQHQYLHRQHQHQHHYHNLSRWYHFNSRLIDTE